MLVDLHCHSTCSDGGESATTIGSMARERGVQLFCLTDHDTTAGTSAAAEAYGGVALRGTELSCVWEERTVHLLVLGVVEGEGAEVLDARLSGVEAARRDRLVAMLDKLDGLGVSLDRAPILAHAATHTPGRPDLAKALVDQGVCSSVREAFDRYLSDKGPAYVASHSVTLDEGLAWGRAAGAKMSLAHPHVFRSHALVEELLRLHKEAGLGGLEAMYGSYGRDERAAWARMADALGLVVTGGSDFHGGGVLPRVDRLGVRFDDARADALCEWLGVSSTPAGP